MEMLVLYTVLQHFAGNDAFSYLKSFNERSSDHPIFWFSLNRHHLTIAQPHWIQQWEAAAASPTEAQTFSIHKEHHQTRTSNIIKQEQGNSSDNKCRIAVLSLKPTSSLTNKHHHLTRACAVLRPVIVSYLEKSVLPPDPCP